MNSLRLFTIILLPLLFTSSAFYGQNIDNLNVVQQVYLLIQDKNAFSKDITVLTSGVKWEVRSTEENYNRHSMNFLEILNKEWESVLFEDLNFLNDDNRVEVTGTVRGRRPAECEYISTRFKHSWTIKDGKIFAFTE